jgi:hypothetical protein
MEGSLAACDSWFQNPAAQASANYGIGSDGTIHCYVDPFALHPNWAWANGVLNNPDATVQELKRQGSALYGNVSPNVYTVSVEHAGFTGDPVPNAEFAASTWLSAYLCQSFGIKADRSWNGILGHYQFDAVNRPACPGFDTATWAAYMDDVAAQLSGPPPPEPIPADPCIELRKYAADAQSAVVRAQAELTKAYESLNFPPWSGG